MVPYGHVRRCMGQWVVCHTTYGNTRGMLVGCNSSHLFLQGPRYQPVSAETNDSPHFVHSFGEDVNTITNVSYYGYGYGNGRTAVALASVVGLTAIGLSALWW